MHVGLPHFLQLDLSSSFRISMGLLVRDMRHSPHSLNVTSLRNTRRTGPKRPDFGLPRYLVGMV